MASTEDFHITRTALETVTDANIEIHSVHHLLDRWLNSFSGDDPSGYVLTIPSPHGLNDVNLKVQPAWHDKFEYCLVDPEKESLPKYVDLSDAIDSELGTH